MVNLHDQYLKIKKELDQAIAETISGSAYISGPAVGEFETAFAAYLKVKHVISCGNGTDALQISLMALGLEPGDEVISPAFTYAATAEAIGLLKLIPVFVDVDPHTFTIDPKKLEKSITAKTKAIIPVHLFGAVANMEDILHISDKYSLHIIEDNAQACGAEYKFSNGRIRKTGTIGTFGTFSFFPSKNLGCFGDGGAICTNDDDLAEKARMISKHGQSAKYKHDILGCNSRLDTLQAAILNVKLNYLDAYNKSRREAAQRYDKLFKGQNFITPPLNPPTGKHVYHQYTLKLTERRDELQEHLQKKGIASVVYYPIPLHRQKAFMSIPNRKGDMENTERLINEVLSVPIDTEIKPEQQEFISNTIIEFYK